MLQLWDWTQAHWGLVTFCLCILWSFCQVSHGQVVHWAPGSLLEPDFWDPSALEQGMGLCWRTNEQRQKQVFK